MQIPQGSAWIEQMFEANSANGGIVRRKIADVEKFGGGLKKLIAYVRAQQFHLIETGDQCVVLCHPGAMKIHC